MADSVAESTPQDALKNLRRFVTYLEDQRANPVLLIGTPDSGKTSMLLSLLSVLRNTPQIAIQPWKETLPQNYPNRAERQEKAHRLYDKALADFMEHCKLPERTEQANGPILVGVDLSIGMWTTRLLFIEASGEDYKLDDSIRNIPDLQPEVAAILKFFQGPLSVILQAPVPDIAVANLAAAHNSINPFLRVYNTTRGQMMPLDNLLYLVTQWDRNELPLTPSSSQFLSYLQQNAPGASWNQYAPAAPFAGSKAAAPFSIGTVKGEELVPLPADKKLAVRHLNICLWNWLWQSIHGSRAITEPLFPREARHPSPWLDALWRQAARSRQRLDASPAGPIVRFLLG